MVHGDSSGVGGPVRLVACHDGWGLGGAEMERRRNGSHWARDGDERQGYGGKDCGVWSHDEAYGDVLVSHSAHSSEVRTRNVGHRTVHGGGRVYEKVGR